MIRARSAARGKESLGAGAWLYVDPRSAKLRPNVRISLAHALARKLSQKLHRIHIEIRNFVRVQYSYQYYRGFI